MLVVLAMAAGTARAQHAAGALIVTASNQATNQLLVFDTGGTLVQTIPTGGQGGVGGNAGGVAVLGRTVAVVNWGSSSVSIFDRHGDRFVSRPREASSQSSDLSDVSLHPRYAVAPILCQRLRRSGGAPRYLEVYDGLLQTWTGQPHGI
jgi:hypothetical protein